MRTDIPLELLAGLTAEEFMRDYWQRKPLLIRRAIPDFKPSLSIQDVRTLVQREEVESRLIYKDENGWAMKTGPFKRLPSPKQKAWTALAQSVDLHDDATASLMHRFRFISDARLDDAMISIASDGGGVGPHFDSYDVFLLQAHGQRRWRISQQQDLTLEPGLPLKILRNFQSEQEFVLDPGDMLYLPPHAAHDGVAIGDCMTISIGFRAPTLATLACGMLGAAADQIMANLGDVNGLYAHPIIPGPDLSETYKDPDALATQHPAHLPKKLIQTALGAVAQLRFDESLATHFLGQWLTELSSNAYFEPSADELDLVSEMPRDGELTLDRCSRMMYKNEMLFINGEVAPIPLSPALKQLADERHLICSEPAAQSLSDDEREILTQWVDDGWLHYTDD
jgi:50S ribosomal protein L16 3-hydroxylase